ncbi:hypothetical protein SCANM63S_03365 [Streptomyces canarius]
MADKAPAQVSLTFSEKVALNDDSLRVLDPKGKPVQTGSPANVSGTTYAVRLKSGLADGTYTVTYQVVSADSHPVAGAYTFSVGAPSQTVVSGAGPAAGGGVVGGLYAFGRYASYAGFIVLAGGAAFVLACWRHGAGVRLQRLVVGGWVALTAATLWLLLLHGAYTGSGKFADVFDLDLLGQVLQTKTGAALVSRLLLLAAAALFVAVLFGTYARPSPTTTLTTALRAGCLIPGRRARRSATWPSGSPSAEWSSRPVSPPAGPWPSTPRPGSSRVSPCRSTSSTCWPSPPGTAARPCCGVLPRRHRRGRHARRRSPLHLLAGGPPARLRPGAAQARPG